MAVNNPGLSQRRQNVQQAEDLLSEIKERANTAHDENNVFMMSIYTELLKVASPIVTKAIVRVGREETSDINKKHKELRQQVRANAPSEA